MHEREQRLAAAIDQHAANVEKFTRGDLSPAEFRPLRLAMGVYALLIVASFGFYLPLLVALPISPDAWRLHIPFRDCAGQTLPDDTTSSGKPPPGWCWI